MRRRISLTMVAMVVGALIFSGLVTLGLTVLDSIHQTQSELVSEASDVAQGINQELAAGSRGPDSFSVLQHTLAVLKGPLGWQNEEVLAVRTHAGVATGTFYNPLAPNEPSGSVLPPGVKATDILTGPLFVPLPVSGHVGRLVWAAELLDRPIPVAPGAKNCAKCGQANLVVVLTREAPSGVGNAGLWFALASAATVIMALIVANRLGHRIARPLKEAQAVTHRIATGDLEARARITGREGPELVSLADSVNQMAASLSRAQRAQRQFLMSVSHDLRTPLTSVRGYAEALVDGTTEDVHRASEVILSEARRLERLVGDLLELAKLEAGAFSLDCGPVDLAQVAAETAMAFEPEAERLGLKIDLTDSTAILGSLEPLSAPPDAVMCYADPDRLAQVVANLVENALKYAAAHVEVTVKMLAGSPLLCVEDDGPGIPAEDLQRVFTRLYQSSAAASRKVGSGLGLAIVEELVQAMGGTVWAESPVGVGPGGARMWVKLGPAPAPRLDSEVGRQLRTRTSPA